MLSSTAALESTDTKVAPIVSRALALNRKEGLFCRLFEVSIALMGFSLLGFAQAQLSAEDGPLFVTEFVILLLCASSSNISQPTRNSSLVLSLCMPIVSMNLSSVCLMFYTEDSTILATIGADGKSVILINTTTYK